MFAIPLSGTLDPLLTQEQLCLSLGALKATGGKGLQPAMDHLFANEGNPVPDLTAVSETSSSNLAPPDQPMDEDEDDLETLRSLGVKGAAAAAAATGASEAEARVCIFVFTQELV